MLVIPAYAKLNLALEVVARRDDGWHEIDTLIVPIDWHDLVGVEVIAAAEGDGRDAAPEAASEFAVTERVDAPSGLLGAEGNLAARAAALIAGAARTSAGRQGFRVWLDKRIPVAAGLGGGSADAAAVLRAGVRLLALLGVEVDTRELSAMAAALGSDVPSLLDTRTVRATGRGELVAPVAPRPMHMTVVFVAPSLTGDVYAAMSAGECRSDGRVARLAALLAAGGPMDSTLLGSGLEPAACRVNAALSNGIARLRAALPAVAWHMTGSGGAFFCITDDQAHAAAVARDAVAAGFVARACRSVG